MIKSIKMLLSELSGYQDPYSRIRILRARKQLFCLKRGWYVTDMSVSPFIYSQVIYGPSYLSFNFALSYYGIIPEAVYEYTSASYNSKQYKYYHTDLGNYSYRNVPKEVFPLEVNVVEECGIQCLIASPEKALCDRLYELPAMKNRKEFAELLFEDLRVDETLLFSMRKRVLSQLSDLYRCNNVRFLTKLLRR